MKIDSIKIKLMMAEMEITRTELAEKAGVSYQCVSAALTRGSCNPKTAGKLAKALGVNVREIGTE